MKIGQIQKQQNDILKELLKQILKRKVADTGETHRMVKAKYEPSDAGLYESVQDLICLDDDDFNDELERKNS